MPKEEKGYQAIVNNIIVDGKHGSYAVARCEELGTVTFSLNPQVWQEEDWPDPGTCVVLSKVRKKRAGWRAEFGRFLTPSDEQQPVIRKEHKA